MEPEPKKKRVSSAAAWREARELVWTHRRRLTIGLGLMLLALHILLNTLAPAENAPGMRVFMNAITGDPVLCILFAAIVTWLVHSSVASVLLVMSLAYAHFITPYAALALVLGANLGSAINPIVEGARRDNPASYRLPLGNLGPRRTSNR